MIRDDTFDGLISDVAVAEEKARQTAHEPSGRISASMMGNVSQWSVLKLLGVPSKDYEPYLLRKFARGNQAEEWFVKNMLKTAPWPKYGQQMEVSYRGGIGFVDMPELVQEDSIVRYRPHEVKSVTNLKYKRLTKGLVRSGVEATGPDTHHILQVAYYALALDSIDAYIHYVASDDLRVASWYIPNVAVYKPEIDAEIDAIQTALKTGKLPEFKAKQPWQEKLDYSQYPQFAGMSAERIENVLSMEYPSAWVKLKGGGDG